MSMEAMYIHETAFTPIVFLDPKTGLLEIKGRSTSENAFGFYQPVIKWMKEYSLDPADEITMSLQFDYFNSSSSKCILDILRLVAGMKQADRRVVIRWITAVEDIDMKETGKDFESLIKIPFVFLSEG
jgi:hypothetical protein